MHDTILLSKISQSLDECCKKQKISKVNKIAVVVNNHSHINLSNLSKYLKNYNENLVDDYTKIKIEIEDLPDQTAIIRSIEGELFEE